MGPHCPNKPNLSGPSLFLHHPPPPGPTEPFHLHPSPSSPISQRTKQIRVRGHFLPSLFLPSNCTITPIQGAPRPSFFFSFFFPFFSFSLFFNFPLTQQRRVQRSRNLQV